MRTFGQMKVLQGDDQLADGIRLISLPGRRPVLQRVLVQTEVGPYQIASDAIGGYENWTGNEMVDHIPQGIH
jgi:hypothetical protein